ncbi:MAG: hypothetical protein HND51_04235 [Chloroflexi bacterium]|nr:hypothetical protein [Chloroflexota bacterium]
MEFRSMSLDSGTQLHYGLVLPANFDAQQTYPILLLLPPGGQTRDMVDAGFSFFANGAIENGWIILSPIAPDGVLFFQGSEALIPEFLSKTAEEFQPEGGKYHIAGISNGGISAFRIATGNADLVHSVLALPGFPRGEDKNKLNLLVNIPVTMFVGELDEGWVGAMQDTETSLNELGGDASLQVMAGEGHVIQSLGDGVALYELLESFREK